MLLILATFFSLFVIQVCVCDTDPMCPVPTLLTVKTQPELGSKMLALFNENEIPQKTTTKKIKYSTKFMMNLYEILSGERGLLNRVKRHFKRLVRTDEIIKAAQCDVVLSMNCVNRISESVGQREKLTFAMPDLPQNAELFEAELKLFQSKKRAQKVPYTMYMISIYKPYQLTSKYMKMKKVAEKITSTDFTGWLSIDISVVFETWLEYRMAFQDLYISLQPFGVDDEKEIHPASIGLIFQNEKLVNEPFIVAFIYANNMIRARLPRHLNLKSKRIEFKDVIAHIDKCNMYALKVSFEDLGWSDWVIAPKGYTSSYCKGSCSFPLKHPMKATNHALIQSLMHLKNPKKFPKPKCAPMDTSQLSVLFKQRENTILKNYKNMIVETCGCQ